VHRGHQMLLARLSEQAHQRNLQVCVMTFEPHPRDFFNPASAPPRIALLRDKLEALRIYGVDQVIVNHLMQLSLAKRRMLLSKILSCEA